MIKLLFNIRRVFETRRYCRELVRVELNTNVLRKRVIWIVLEVKIVTRSNYIEKDILREIFYDRFPARFHSIKRRDESFTEF